MRPLPMSFNWLIHSTASQAQLFPWKISKSTNALFRFPTTSGWLLPETTLRFFFTCTGSHAPSSLTSSRFNVITTALSTTFPALSRVTYTPCLCFPLFFLTFPLRNDRSRAQRISAAWHFSSFTKLHTEITPASCTSLAFHVVVLQTHGARVWTYFWGCNCSF